MSSILSGLEEKKAGLSKDVQLVEQVSELKAKSIKKLRRAVLPVAGVLAKGALKKFIGTGFEEIAEAAGAEFDAGSSDLPVSEALDKFFEESLREHQNRQQRIQSFKESLTDLLVLLSNNECIKNPLFVFIDEVDRCRPTYAISLLEEIKHLFGVEGVVYVVSTNISQLQSSVRAIYGADFDGRRYLRRLFDREYSLPAADPAKFAEDFLNDWRKNSGRKFHLGLPSRGQPKASIAVVWSLICEGFEFDLRSQKQIISVAKEAANGLPKESPLHALWLLFLSGLYHKKPEIVRFLSNRVLSSKQFNEAVLASGFRDVGVKWVSHGPDPFNRDGREKQTSLMSALNLYFDISQKSSREVFDMNSGFDYPSSIISEVQEEFGGMFYQNTAPYPSLRFYASAVVGAGYLVTSA